MNRWRTVLRHGCPESEAVRTALRPDRVVPAIPAQSRAVRRGAVAARHSRQAAPLPEAGAGYRGEDAGSGVLAERRAGVKGSGCRAFTVVDDVSGDCPAPAVVP